VLDWPEGCPYGRVGVPVVELGRRVVGHDGVLRKGMVLGWRAGAFYGGAFRLMIGLVVGVGLG
jgi:hypothetical protein